MSLFCAKYNSQPMTPDGTARHYAFLREYEVSLEDNPDAWMSHDPPKKHTSTWMVTLNCKMPNFGPHKIQRQLQYDANSEYLVLYAMIALSLLVFISVCWAMNLSLSWWNVAWQWIQPGFNKTVPDLVLTRTRTRAHTHTHTHTHTLTVSSNSSADSVSWQCNMNRKLSMPLFLHSNARTIRTLNSFVNKHFLNCHI
jgi:hypothetical protein